MYAIIDIETTGGRHQDKITEVAIIIHSGQRVVDTFSTLINPEVSIPYYITKLTGISTEMVADAPKFYEVAKKIIELTQNCIFVAHNVSFDYNFIKKEFKELGYEYKRDTLCTVKLSRKLVSGLKSYSLGNLCEDLGIIISDRHRALGDALATAKLFEHLLGLSGQKNDLFAAEDLKAKTAQTNLDPQKIRSIPEETGVYYFHNQAGDVIYVGKSNNLYKRILSHLSNSTARALRMKEQMADISFELTGNELVALLLEDDEIKRLKPLFNRAQRRTMPVFGIFLFENEDGYKCLKIEKTDQLEIPLLSFENKEKAIEFLSKIIEKYRLCQKFAGLYKSDGACFNYSVRQCDGACIGNEQPATYNQRVNDALSYYFFGNESFILIDKGRRKDEKSLVAVKNGKYLGYGFVDISQGISHIDDILSEIKHMDDNKSVHQIILRYLRHHKVDKVLKF